jgi:hypothetical protein
MSCYLIHAVLHWYTHGGIGSFQSDNFYFSNWNFYNTNGFASSSSQIASRIELPNLLVFQPGNSTQIHLGIGMEFLCNVPANTAQKGFFL